MSNLVVETGTLSEFRKEYLKFIIDGEGSLSDGEETPQSFFEEVVSELLAMRDPDPLTEEWRPVPEFPHYSINRCGEVMNARGWIMSPGRNTSKGSRNRQTPIENYTFSVNHTKHCRSVGALLKSAFKDDYR